jgi:GTP pyrophosphokinase
MVEQDSEKRIRRLEKKIEDNYGKEALSIFHKALSFAENAHRGQKRSSGEPYTVHPIEVALILVDLGLDINTIIAGLLHDTAEDAGISISEIERQFGSEVAKLVDGITKLGKFEFKTKEEQQVETLRKMFLAMGKDIRVIIIKFADRLHNLRTLEYIEEDKQREKAYETLEIYAPLAHRLGIFKIKWELEDLSLRYIDPTGYYDLVEKISTKRREREEQISLLIDVLREKMEEAGIKADIEGRPKHFYSIYRKMYMQHKSFDQIYDLMAVRIIVDEVKDCYEVLGIAHTLWKPIPGRFKDYIAVAKPNMYRSLHTTVIGPSGEPFEIQIRTWEMHHTAEYGIAAHWKYKEGRKSQSELDDKLSWLRQLLEWQHELSDFRDFTDTLKVDLFTDEVFVFTPKGDVIDLPKGAIPLDFAYAIHSAIGNRCVGAKVNGKIVTLDYELQTGEIVEILTSSAGHGPSRDWLKMVKTSEARSKIKQWFKKEKREENIVKGKELIEKEAKKQGFILSRLLKNEWLEPILHKYGLHSTEDMFAAIGYGGITVNQVLLKLIDEYKKANQDDPVEPVIKEVVAPKRQYEKGIAVKGIDNVMIRLAKCCNPVHGDDIVGYITRGRGVSIHRSDCGNLSDVSVENHRFIDVNWTEEPKASYSAGIYVIARDRHSILAEVTMAIADMKIAITAVNAKTDRNKRAHINLTLQITDTLQLEKVMRQLKKLFDVIDVSRIKM